MKAKTKSNKKTSIQFKDVKDTIKGLVQSIDNNWYDLAKELHEVYDTNMFTYWGYNTFRDYVEDDLKLEYRTAAYRVKIGWAIKEYGIRRNTVLDLGWTKFKEIIPYFSEDDTKNQKLIEMAKELTVKELQVALKKNKASKKQDTIKMSFSFNQEQADILDEAFKLGEAMLKTTDKSRILEAIISDWLANNQ